SLSGRLQFAWRGLDELCTFLGVGFRSRNGDQRQRAGLVDVAGATVRIGVGREYETQHSDRDDQRRGQYRGDDDQNPGWGTGFTHPSTTSQLTGSRLGR